MSIETYEKVQYDKYDSLDAETVCKKDKILIISQNSTDIFLVNKLLNQLGNFKVYEAANLKAAQKITSYLELDLIIVDDMLPNIGGYEIIKRLNKNHILRSIPKVLLLTQGYQATIYDNIIVDNLDFIKKPIDNIIFKTRINSILKNRQDKFNSGSLFENMIDAKISGAKEFLKIYKSFLDMDQNILFIYDKDKNEVVEYNKNFTKFFGKYSLVNRLISNKRVMKKFIPYMSDSNYLNSHDANTWIDLITSIKDFNFIITLKIRNKEFSFNVQANKMKLFGKNMYIIKLSNHDLYLPKIVKKDVNQKIDLHLRELFDLLNEIEEGEKRDKIRANIISLLNELDIKVPNFENNDDIKTKEINVYFVIAKTLKDRINTIKARLNSKIIREDFDVNSHSVHANISQDAVSEMLKGILDSYHDGTNLKVDVKVYKLKDDIKIEIVTTSDKETTENNSFVSKLLHNNDSYKQNDSLYNITPKNLEKVLNLLNATLKTHFTNGQNIFIVTIPVK